MRKICLTLYETVYTKSHAQVAEQTWEEWKTLLLNHDIRDKKDGPGFVPGLVEPTREDVNVRFLDIFCGDIEKHPEEKVDEVLAKLEKIGLDMVVHSTFSHGSPKAKGMPRLRVVLPWVSRLDSDAYVAAWPRVNALFDNILDTNCRNPSHFYWFPSAEPGRPLIAYHRTGQPLSLDDLPSLPAVAPPAASPGLQRLRNVINTMPRDHRLKEAARALLAGAAFAENPERHNTIIALTGWMVSRDHALSRAVIDALFAPSIEKMQAGPPPPPTLDEVWRAYSDGVKKWGEQRRVEVEQLIHTKQRRGFEPYSEEDLAKIAGVQGCDVRDLDDRWVALWDGGGWCLTSTGSYAGPYTWRDMQAAMLKHLARAPVRLYDLNQKGAVKRPIVDVVAEHGSLVEEVITDMTRDTSVFFKETATMYEAARPVRHDLKPRFDPKIDEWLKILGGTLYSKLVDWLAIAPDLDKLLCAIYFKGPKACGKTLFAVGVAKLWTEGPPADIEHALSGFNEELKRCPLVLADEEIPKNYKHENVTTKLRSLLSNYTRTLSRKFRQTSELRGAVRLILTANNEFLLDSSSSTTGQDIEAIAERFLYVEVSEDASKYLSELPLAVKQEWAKSGIAEHSLALRETRAVEPGKRFWVEGVESPMHQQLVTGSKWNSLVSEWLVRYLTNPNGASVPYGFVHVHEGKLYINNQGILDTWNAVLKHADKPDSNKVGTALASMSLEGKKIQQRWGVGGKHVKYWVINTTYLFAWAERYNIGDEATMRATLAQDTGKPSGKGRGNVSKISDYRSPTGVREDGGLDYNSKED